MGEYLRIFSYFLYQENKTYCYWEIFFDNKKLNSTRKTSTLLATFLTQK